MDRRPIEPQTSTALVWVRMKRISDRIFLILTLFATLIVLTMLGVIVGNIAYYGTARLSWQFITAAPERGMTEGGIFPAIYGTVFLVLLMSVAAVPFGVLVAIYFAEYARAESRLYRWTRMAVNNLAGVPSIVFGLFGLGFFIQSIGKTFGGSGDLKQLVVTVAGSDSFRMRLAQGVGQ